jgi:hypothetical protein
MRTSPPKRDTRFDLLNLRPPQRAGQSPSLSTTTSSVSRETRRQEDGLKPPHLVQRSPLAAPPVTEEDREHHGQSIPGGSQPESGEWLTPQQLARRARLNLYTLVPATDVPCPRDDTHQRGSERYGYQRHRSGVVRKVMIFVLIASMLLIPTSFFAARLIPAPNKLLTGTRQVPQLPLPPSPPHRTNLGLVGTQPPPAVRPSGSRAPASLSSSTGRGHR